MTKNTTINGGIPTVFIGARRRADAASGSARSPARSSRPATPTGTVDGLEFMTNDEAREDILRPLQNAAQSIDFVSILLWIVAACIIGSIVYLSAMERTRDFAVFKATGTSNGSLGGRARDAGGDPVGRCRDRSPRSSRRCSHRCSRFPSRSRRARTSCCSSIAIVVGLLASLAGLRRAVKVEPALAFGGP